MVIITFELSAVYRENQFCSMMKPPEFRYGCGSLAADRFSRINARRWLALNAVWVKNLMQSIWILERDRKNAVLMDLFGGWSFKLIYLIYILCVRVGLFLFAFGFVWWIPMNNVCIGDYKHGIPLYHHYIQMMHKQK